MWNIVRLGLILLGFLVYVVCGLLGTLIFHDDAVLLTIIADLAITVVFCPVFPFYKSPGDLSRVGTLWTRPVLWLAIISFSWLVIQLTTAVLVSSGVSMGTYGDTDKFSGFAYLFLTVVFAPLCEELFVRRFLFGNLLLIMPAAPALVMQAFVFAVMHGSAIHMYSALAAGLLFGTVYLYTGSVKTCIILHSVYNLACLLSGGLVLPGFLFSPVFLLIANCILFSGLLFLGHSCVMAHRKDFDAGS